MMDDTLQPMSSSAFEHQHHEHRTAFYRNAQETVQTGTDAIMPNGTEDSVPVETTPSSAQSKDAVRLRSMMNQAGIYSSSIDWSTRVREAGLTELDNDTKKAIDAPTEKIARKRDMIPFPEFGTRTVDDHSNEAAAIGPVQKPSEASTYIEVLPSNEVVNAADFQEVVDTRAAGEDGVARTQTLYPAPEAPIEEPESVSVAENVVAPDSPAMEATPAEISTSNSSANSDLSEAELHVLQHAADRMPTEPTTTVQTEKQSVPHNGYRYTSPVQEALNTIQTRAEKGEPDLFIGRPRRNRKKIGAVTVGTIGFVGVLIGLGLYAGGGDILTKLFPNQEREALTAERTPDVNRSGVAIIGSVPENPAAITSREADPVETTQNSGGSALISSVADAPATQSTGQESNGVVTQEISAHPTQSAEVTPLKTTENKPVAATVDVSKRHLYIVQVRATTDQTEAKRIVRRLKNTGLSDVSVEKTEKTGLHRIRFEYPGTKTEAIAAAEKAGYDDVWIVGQK